MKTKYRSVSVDGEKMHEHRAVMERVLGRKLHAWEAVHHKNGDRLDNSPDNLELWTRAHPSGQRVDDLIAFVVQNYPDEVEAAWLATHSRHLRGVLGWMCTASDEPLSPVLRDSGASEGVVRGE